MSSVLFNGNEIKNDNFYDEGSIWYMNDEADYSQAKKVFQVLDESNSGIRSFVYCNYDSDQYFSLEGELMDYDECNDEQKKFINNMMNEMQNYMDALGFHQKVVFTYFSDSDYPYVQFSSINMLNDVAVCTNYINGMLPDIKSCGQSMNISDNGLNQFVILSDFVVDEAETCQLMSWNSLTTILEELANSQKLRRDDDAAKITHIELKYLITHDDDLYEFHPVWSFEAEFSIGITAPVFAINAVDGTLEFINGMN